MPKCDFNKVAIQTKLRHGCSPVNLLYIFRTPFPRSSSGWLLLDINRPSPRHGHKYSKYKKVSQYDGVYMY